MEIKIKSKGFWLVLLPFLIIVGFLFYVYADGANYWKVTDPHDPRFHPENFVFNDYNSDKELAAALRVLVPVGMQRVEAEKFLDGSPDKRGGEDRTNDEYLLTGYTIKQKIDVEALREKSSKVLSYGFGGKRKLMNPLSGGWNVMVFYDKQDRVLQIIVRNEPLYDEGRR